MFSEILFKLALLWKEANFGAKVSSAKDKVDQPVARTSSHLNHAGHVYFEPSGFQVSKRKEDGKTDSRNR